MSGSRRVPRVLAFARPDDPSLPLVSAALARRGGELSLVDLPAFPARLSLSLSVGPGAEPLRVGGYRLDDFGACWIRHLEVGAGLPAELAPEHRAACQALASATLSSALECLDGFVLDPLTRLHAAPMKPRQGRLAAACGLEVPRTLVSNDPAAIRAFAARCGGRVVAKMIDSGTVLFGEGEAAEVLPTLLLSLEDLQDLPGIELSPMIFQELIDKQLEARVTVVGRRLFSAAVRTGDIVDMRQDPALIAGLRPCPLPPALESALLEMVRRVGLNFATFDLILTPEGRWVFLEMNTVSFFDHVERHAGLPISDAIAELLLGLAPPLAEAPGTA